jgi:hypothetical protein
MTMNDQNGKSNRPKPVFFWNNADVMKWLKRHCEEYHGQYSELFVNHEITGRSMVRLNDESLLKMGIKDARHRDDLLRTILKLKLKSDILDLKDLERKGGEVNSSSSIGMS